MVMFEVGAVLDRDSKFEHLTSWVASQIVCVWVYPDIAVTCLTDTLCLSAHVDRSIIDTE